MFNLTAASAVSRMFDFVEQIAAEFEHAGFAVEGVFHKRWSDGDCGMYIKCGPRTVLFLGLWSELWRDRGHPLCIGVHRGKWSPKVIARFQRFFPEHEVYPPSDLHPFLVKGVDPILCVGDPVKMVSGWLLRGYLNGIGDLFRGDELPAPDGLQ